MAIKREACLRVERHRGIKQAAKCRDLPRYVIRRNGKLFPIGRISADYPHVTFFVVDVDNNESLVIGE